MAADESPHLRVVSDRSSAEVDRTAKEKERQRRLDAVNERLVTLTANLMRVVRGAGKPWDVGLHCGAVVDAYYAYREEVGHWPTSGEIGEALRFDKGWDGVSAHDEIAYGRTEIVQGALQFAASTMLEQHLHIRLGKDEMERGMRTIREERERNLAKLREHERAARKPGRAKAKKVKANCDVEL